MNGRERGQNDAGTPAWKSPVAFSVSLHLLILVIAISGWSWSSSNYEPPPRSISARLISSEPRPAPAVTEVDQPDEAEQRLVEDRKLLEQQREAEQQVQRQEAERKAEEQKQLEEQRKEEQRKKVEAERQKREQQVQEQAEQTRVEDERKRQEAERRLREQNLKALAQQATDAEADLARESQQAAAARAQEAQMLTDSAKYQELIRARVTEVWYYPSSTTEGMKVQLQLSLLPTGELTGVTLVRGSGNMAFDNSALSAVRSLNRYPVPPDRNTFERYFRRFTIEFTPSR